jgi:formylglycine-generating enzyme required for sulfatase activity
MNFDDLQVYKVAQDFIIPGTNILIRNFQLSLIPKGTLGLKDNKITSITQPFYIGSVPVTQEQWSPIARQRDDLRMNPSFTSSLGACNPVNKVSWSDASKWCATFQKLLGLSVRLPTTYEWEYSCRAGTNTLFNFGNEITPELANISGAICKVKSFPANPFGLYDMHGNVWEWCQDVTVDLGAPLKGGSFLSPPPDTFLPEWTRYESPTYKASDVGFRFIICRSNNSNVTTTSIPGLSLTMKEPTPV